MQCKFDSSFCFFVPSQNAQGNEKAPCIQSSDIIAWLLPDVAYADMQQAELQQ